MGNLSTSMHPGVRTSRTDNFRRGTRDVTEDALELALYRPQLRLACPTYKA